FLQNNQILVQNNQNKQNV
ncbi:hypothetical protein CP01DC11_0627B, partial [Chlamydia psittaci 01DC11]